MNTSTNPAQVPGRILVENVRASFVDGIWQPSAPPGTNSEPAYNMQAILPRDHPQVAQLVQLINEAAQRQWKEHWQQVLAVAQAAGKVFLKSGDTKKYEGYAGNLFISARSKKPVTVSDGMENGKPRIVHNRADSRIYSGCYVNLLIDVFPYTRGSNGVGASLKGVQFLRDGEPLGGGAPVGAEDFGEVEEAADAANEFGALFGTPTPAGNAAFDTTQQPPAVGVPQQPAAQPPAVGAPVQQPAGGFDPNGGVPAGGSGFQV